MKSTKRKKGKLEEAGITLVALVVTIIVLLILAGVTINLALSNNGIIQRAKSSSNTWAEATENETTMMSEAEEHMISLSNTTASENNPDPIIETVPSFTIQGKRLFFEPGMTWREWIQSTYNTAGFYEYATNRSDTPTGLKGKLMVWYDGWPICTDDEIVPEDLVEQREYYWSMW